MSIAGELREWAIIFLKNRDIYQKEIKELETLNGDFIVRKTDSDTLFLIRPDVDVDEIAEKDGKVSVVMCNRKSNVAAVAKGWDKIKAKPQLCLFFVNPKTNEKWMIYPKTHDLITEPAALKKGLESLCSMVEEC